MAALDGKAIMAPATDMNSAEHGQKNGQTQHLDQTSTNASRTFQPPEIIRNMSPEERRALEKKLIRKIDFRLLPMIVLMYIMNYIDRYDTCLSSQAILLNP